MQNNNQIRGGNKSPHLFLLNISLKYTFQMKISCLRGALVYLAIFLSYAASAENKLPQLGKDPIP